MPGTLAQALVKAQAEMPKVEPNARNPHFKSEFVTIDHLIAKTKPVLTKHGLAIVQIPVVTEHGHVLRSILLHAGSDESIEADTPLLGTTDMQKLGAAITYARRFAWAALLGISDETDDDGNTASKPEPAADDGKFPPLTELELEATAAATEWANEIGSDTILPELQKKCALKRTSPGYEKWLTAARDSYRGLLADKRAQDASAFQVPEKARR